MGQRTDTLSVQIQKPNFFQISWCLLHPFNVSSAFKISKRSVYITDSLIKANVIKNSIGGEADAFRHLFWVIKLQKEIGKNATKSLISAHEKNNLSDFRKKFGFEDTLYSKMDFFNNNLALEIADTLSSVPEEKLIQMILNLIENKKVKTISYKYNLNWILLYDEKYHTQDQIYSIIKVK